VPKFLLLLSKWAEDDLAGIADYTLETWGEHQLARYRSLLEQGFDTITRDPNSLRSKAREELFPGCRSLHIGRHLILYRVKGSTVEIARVLHDSMELERHLPTELLTAGD